MAQIRRHRVWAIKAFFMEQSSLAVHRVLIVGGKTHAAQLLRSVLSIAGLHRISQVEDRARALEILSTEHFSAVFVGADVAPVEGVSFAVAIRRREGMLNPMIPVFALQERARRRDVEQARDEGVTDVLTVPISPRTLTTKLQAAFETPRTFIVSQQFFGPDRRAKVRPAWFGKDRRTRAARKAKADLTVKPDITHI
jgi:PleD family two-component response regulator